MFVSEKVINEIANDDELADRGLPRRRSLAGLIAKVAAATWAETVLATKMKLEA